MTVSQQLTQSSAATPASVTLPASACRSVCHLSLALDRGSALDGPTPANHVHKTLRPYLLHVRGRAPHIELGRGLPIIRHAATQPKAPVSILQRARQRFQQRALALQAEPHKETQRQMKNIQMKDLQNDLLQKRGVRYGVAYVPASYQGKSDTPGVTSDPWVREISHGIWRFEVRKRFERCKRG
jgi:hypothetical protein